MGMNLALPKDESRVARYFGKSGKRRHRFPFYGVAVVRVLSAGAIIPRVAGNVAGNVTGRVAESTAIVALLSESSFQRRSI
jgi:hypothetical protein